MGNQESHIFRWHYTTLDDSNFQIHGRTVFFVVVLLCVMLFMTLVCLRWACRVRSHSSASRFGHPTSPEITPPRGLDPNAITNLPIVLQGVSANPNEAECPICLGIFEEGEKVKVLPHCRHCYHSECVDEWLKTQSSCPLCRASLLRVESIV